MATQEDIRSIYAHRIIGVNPNELYGRLASDIYEGSYEKISSPIVSYPFHNDTIWQECEFTAKYTQGELWAAVGQPEPVVVDGRDEEVMPISWITSIANGINKEHHSSQYKVTVNENVPGFAPLNGWLEKCEMRGDGCFLYIDIPKEGDCLLPALWTETVSNKDFCSSINKAARGVITQLRCLRCYSDKIVQCKGFVFPAFNHRSMVVLVIVTWQNLTMVVDLVFLKCEDLKKHVVDALTLMRENREKLLDTERGDYFIRLSAADLDLLVHDVEERWLAFQIASKHSIVIATTAAIYNLPPTFSEYGALYHMLELNNSTATTDRLCLPCRRFWIDRASASVFVFPVVKYQPMKLEEVARCMKSFAETAAEAIQQLHGLGYTHGDIHLPNICFNEKFEAVLIDFDRTEMCEHFKRDWRDFGRILVSLKEEEVWNVHWRDFVSNLLEGNEPEFRVLEDQENVHQVNVESVLCARGL